MPDSVEIKLEGFAELAELLKNFGPKVAKNGLRAATFAGAKVVREAAKQLVPVRTGALRDSLSVFRRRTDDNVATYSVGLRRVRLKYADSARNRRLRRAKRAYYVNGPTFYGRFVELGTSKMRPHPFLRPAFDNNTSAILNAIRERLAKAVDVAAAKANKG